MNFKAFLNLAVIMICSFTSLAQNPIIHYADSNKTPTYFETIAFYQMAAAASDYISIDSTGSTDAGYPLHTVIIDKQKVFKRPDNNRCVLLINNAIHPGEPDGVDACIRMTNEFVQHPEFIPDHVVLVIIPIYNIGGSLNRNSHSRANQNGPEEYGFRGNAKNYDLNRDFIKQDTKNAAAFSSIFHQWEPELFIDTHVSNGADYQHVMTLVPTQHDKLSPPLSYFLRDTILPKLYNAMESGGYPMSPYVNPLGDTPDLGIVGFMDHPRYSTGYAALFNCIGFMTETHMLKPYIERVKATEIFIDALINFGEENYESIVEQKALADNYNLNAEELPLDWLADLNCYDSVYFRGYTAAYKPSEVSGKDRLYYDRSKPWEKNIPLYDHYDPDKKNVVPQSYFIPAAWTDVIQKLKHQGVEMNIYNSSGSVEVEVYTIGDYNTSDNSYEGHYRHTGIEVTKSTTEAMLKGYYEIPLNQKARRFIFEVLEPIAPDSYFSWNMFDPILMQKEWYSPYVFEDLAADLLENDAELKALFEEKKRKEPAFANNGEWQLYYLYTHSPHYEPGHNRYPVLRKMK